MMIELKVGGRIFRAAFSESESLASGGYPTAEGLSSEPRQQPSGRCPFPNAAAPNPLPLPTTERLPNASRPFRNVPVNQLNH
jgi:hypothetical protein